MLNITNIEDVIDEILNYISGLIGNKKLWIWSQRLYEGKGVKSLLQLIYFKTLSLSKEF
ncbi:hypothetical protein GCM10022393_33920 [Aquimarina addita]|uniref:Uncharacterized protein n=2 Tax=Aquimarina addita TaxID=870485 RepID=A0ABP6UR80_9FLAO